MLKKKIYCVAALVGFIMPANINNYHLSGSAPTREIAEFAPALPTKSVGILDYAITIDSAAARSRQPPNFSKFLLGQNSVELREGYPRLLWTKCCGVFRGLVRQREIETLRERKGQEGTDRFAREIIGGCLPNILENWPKLHRRVRIDILGRPAWAVAFAGHDDDICPQLTHRDEKGQENGCDRQAESRKQEPYLQYLEAVLFRDEIDLLLGRIRHAPLLAQVGFGGTLGFIALGLIVIGAERFLFGRYIIGALLAFLGFGLHAALWFIAFLE